MVPGFQQQSPTQPLRSSLGAALRSPVRPQPSPVQQVNPSINKADGATMASVASEAQDRNHQAGISAPGMPVPGMPVPGMPAMLPGTVNPPVKAANFRKSISSNGDDCPDVSPVTRAFLSRCRASGMSQEQVKQAAARLNEVYDLPELEKEALLNKLRDIGSATYQGGKKLLGMGGGSAASGAAAGNAANSVTGTAAGLWKNHGDKIKNYGGMAGNAAVGGMTGYEMGNVNDEWSFDNIGGALAGAAVGVGTRGKNNLLRNAANRAAAGTAVGLAGEELGVPGVNSFRGGWAGLASPFVPGTRGSTTTNATKNWERAALAAGGTQLGVRGLSAASGAAMESVKGFVQDTVLDGVAKDLDMGDRENMAKELKGMLQGGLVGQANQVMDTIIGYTGMYSPEQLKKMHPMQKFLMIGGTAAAAAGFGTGNNTLGALGAAAAVGGAMYPGAQAAGAQTTGQQAPPQPTPTAVDVDSDLRQHVQQVQAPQGTPESPQIDRAVPYQQLPASRDEYQTQVRV